MIESTRVESGRPRTANHFRAIRAHLEITIRRNTLVQRWDRQMAPLGALDTDKLIETHIDMLLAHLKGSPT